jgi:hypothetical protein
MCAYNLLGISLRLLHTSTAQPISDYCPKHAALHESDEFSYTWRGVLDILLWPTHWLKSLEPAESDAHFIDHNHHPILIVIPVDTESDLSQEAEDVDYMSDNDYYPQSPGLQQVFLTLEPPVSLPTLPSASPPLLPLDSIEKDAEARPENAQDYFLLDFLLDRPGEKEDRVMQLTTAAAERRREKLYDLPLLPNASRPGQRRKRDQSTQGDWVLIREMAPNLPDIANEVSRYPLSSCPSESSQSVIQENEYPFEAELNLALYGTTACSQASPSTSSPSTVRTRRQSGIIELQRYDPRYPGLLLQPDSRPISQEQLAAEVKSIYAGLTMVETKRIHVNRAPRSVLASDPSESGQTVIGSDRTLDSHAQPPSHRQHLFGTPSMCSLERLLDRPGAPHQDVENDTSLVVDWGNFDPAGFDRHVHPDPNLNGLGDWLPDDIHNISIESISEVLRHPVDDELAWCIDAGSEIASQFTFETYEPLIQIADQINVEFIHAARNDDRAGQTNVNVTSSLVDNDAVDDWRWSDDTIGDWIQPTGPNRFLQRHLFRQPLLDQWLLIAPSTLDAYLSESIIIPESIDLDQRSQSGNSALSFQFEQESRENTSEEVVFSASVVTCLKRNNTDESEESLEVSLPSKRIRRSERDAQSHLEDASSTFIAPGSSRSHTRSDTVVPIEESIAITATTTSAPLSPITQSPGESSDPPSVHICSDCLMPFTTARILA